MHRDRNDPGLMTTIDEIIENFAVLDDWDDRYRYVIELGRTLEPLPEALRSESNKVQGCASQVWMATRVRPDGATLDLYVQLRSADPSTEPDAIPGALIHRSRDLTTRATVRDGQSVLLGGVTLTRRLGNRRAFPWLGTVAPLDVVTGFVSAEGKDNGRPVGVAIDRRGELLVADDVGNVVWRVKKKKKK